MFVVFLLLFSYVMLCEFYPIKHLNADGVEIGQDIQLPEKVLIFWVGMFTLDEFNHVIFT